MSPNLNRISVTQIQNYVSTGVSFQCLCAQTQRHGQTALTQHLIGQRGWHAGKRLSMNTITPNEIRRITRKRGNCECIATSGSPTPRMQSIYALISIHMSSLNSLSLSVAVLERFTAYTLRYAVTLNSDPVILTYDL